MYSTNLSKDFIYPLRVYIVHDYIQNIIESEEVKVLGVRYTIYCILYFNFTLTIIVQSEFAKSPSRIPKIYKYQ